MAPFDQEIRPIAPASFVTYTSHLSWLTLGE